MATTDPILTALARLEERLVERMDEWRRELQLDLDGRFDAVHRRLDRLEQEYEMIRAGLARLEADVGTLKSDVGTLKSDVGTLKSDVAALTTAVARMQTEIVLLRETIARLEGRLEPDRSDRQDLRDQLVQFRRRLGDLEDRVQAIEGRLTQG